MAFGGATMATFAYTALARGHVLHDIYGDHELWHTNPLYVAFRAGAVFAGLGAAWLCEPLLARAWARHGAVTAALSLLARRSLLAYVTHLLVLYGTPFTPALQRVLRDRPVSIVAASAISLGLIAFTLVVAWGWQELAQVWTARRQARALGT
jgi:hypothetical protein